MYEVIVAIKQHERAGGEMTQLRVLQSARELSAIDPELLRSGRGEDCEEEANRDRGVFQHGIITQKPELPQRPDAFSKSLRDVP